MSTSTSGRNDDAATISAAVVSAAEAAGALLPATSVLSCGSPVDDPDIAPLPGDSPAAITARLSGEVSGDVVLVVAGSVVEALANSPVGKLDVAAAMRPALEAAAAVLGRVTVTSERMEEPEAALDGLRDKGVFLAVPLLAGGEHQATLALQVTLPRPSAGTQRGSLELLRNVAMEVTVEIGRTRMTVQELLSLYPGEIVELDRAASAPADLLVNGTLIARGEVVVVDEEFGLRITEVVTDAAAAELGQASA